MRKFWIFAALAWPALVWADVPPPPGTTPTDTALDAGAVMGKQTQAEYDQFSGQNAFASGAASASDRYDMPTSPLSHAPAAAPFASMGTIPGDDTPPPPTSPNFDKVPQMPASNPAPMPANLPPEGSSYVPPPAGAPASTIHAAALNTEGFAAGEPPHMSFAKARADSVPVTGTRIRVSQGVTYGVTVSGVAPNLFVTPFAHPRLIVGDRTFARRFTHGRDIFIGATPSFPVGVYITGKNPEDPVVSLTLIPAKIPARIYRLEFPGFVPHRAPITANRSSYAARMVDLMRDAVLDEMPDNYRNSRRIPPLGAAIPLQWKALHNWVGYHYRIVQYRITNNTISPITLAENDLYTKSVLAVSLYPHHRLYPGESTTAYLVETLPPSKHGLGDVWR